MTGTSGGSPLSSNSTSGGLNLTGIEEDLSGAGVDTNTTDWASAWGAFGCLATKFALMIGYGAWQDGACSMLGKLSLVLGALSLGVATASIGVSDPIVSTAMSLTSVAMGVLGIYFSLTELTNVQRSAIATARFSIIVSAISLVVSGVGIYLSIDDLCNREE